MVGNCSSCRSLYSWLESSLPLTLPTFEEMSRRLLLLSPLLKLELLLAEAPLLVLFRFVLFFVLEVLIETEAEFEADVDADAEFAVVDEVEASDCGGCEWLGELDTALKLGICA